MTACSYCNETAEARDHVPPISSYSLRKRKGQKHLDKPWVWACTECNCLLHNKMLLKIGLRAEYIALKLSSRYRNLLAMPDWNEDELATLEYNIRVSVIGQLREKERVKIRILSAWLVTETAYEDIPEILCVTDKTLDELDL